MRYKDRSIRRVRVINAGVGALLFLLALLASAVYGQQDFRGSIQGQVKDPSGGIIPGVSVTATLTAQNKTHTAVTNINV